MMEMKSIQKTARIAGFLYLLLIPLGIFGILYVPSVLVAPGDIATTISNIMAHESLFRLSIVSALLTGGRCDAVAGRVEARHGGARRTQGIGSGKGREEVGVLPARAGCTIRLVRHWPVEGGSSVLFVSGLKQE